MSDPTHSTEPTVTGNSQAEEMGLTGIPPDHLMHVVNVGFTERFMGGVRVRNEGGGFKWRDKVSGVAEKEPFNVERHDAQMLHALRQFCAHPSNRMVWTLESTPQDFVICRIGRPIGDKGEAAQLAATGTPSFGVSIALAMLHCANFNFRETHRELYEDAPRLHLVN